MESRRLFWIWISVMCGMVIEHTDCKLCPVNGEQMRGYLDGIWRRLAEKHAAENGGAGEG